jgi:hypothetical protein
MVKSSYRLTVAVTEIVTNSTKAIGTVKLLCGTKRKIICADLEVIRSSGGVATVYGVVEVWLCIWGSGGVATVHGVVEVWLCILGSGM